MGCGASSTRVQQEIGDEAAEAADEPETRVQQEIGDEAAEAADEPESPYRVLCTQGCTLKEKYRVGKKVADAGGAGAEIFRLAAREDDAPFDVRRYRKKNLDEDDTSMLVGFVKDVYSRLADRSSCPNIVQLVECFEDDRMFYVVTERCAGDELFDAILEAGYFTEPRAAAAMRSIVAAIKQLHEHGIVHRDIKPESLRFKDRERTMKSLALCELESAVVLPAGQKLDRKIGTPYYIAPEVLAKNYGYACDMWSAGVVTYILLTGVPPFNGPSDHKIMERVRAAEWSWEDSHQEALTISEEAKDFVAQLLQANPDARPSAEEALRHPWVEQYRDEPEVISKAKPQSTAATSMDGPSHMHRMKLRKAVASLVRAHKLGRADSDELADVFRKFDGDGNGTLNVEELRAGIRESMEWAPELHEEGGVDAILRALDADGDGTVNYLEFAAGFELLAVRARGHFAREMFASLDEDSDGRVLRSELESALGEDIVADVTGKDQAIVTAIWEGLKAALAKDGEAELGLAWEDFSAIVADAISSAERTATVE